jgi:hypothetical protein
MASTRSIRTDVRVALTGEEVTFQVIFGIRVEDLVVPIRCH